MIACYAALFEIPTALAGRYNNPHKATMKIMSRLIIPNAHHIAVKHCFFALDAASCFIARK
jgi:hypothetical protein